MTLKGELTRGELTRGLKNDVIWLSFMRATESQNMHFDGLLLSKVYKVLDEKVQKSCVL